MKTWICYLSLLMAGVAQAADKQAAVIALFQQSCVKCHGKDDKVKGEVNLVEIRTAADLTSDLERLQAVIEVLNTTSP